METWQILLTGGCGAAIIKLFDGIIQWALQRKAFKDDREEQCQAEEHSERMAWRKQTDESIAALKAGLRILLLEDMKQDAVGYIDAQAVKYDERALLHKKHDVYHNMLDGNGDFDDLMEQVDDLPLIL